MDYTKGKWTEMPKAKGNVVCGDRVIANCNCYTSNMEDVSAENYANAQLIAAAPDMYEALKVAKFALECADMIDKTNTCRAALIDVLNALSKAEGIQ